MSDSLIATKTLEERIAEKMADVVGDLITQADMLEIVEKGINKALFETRSRKSDSWDIRTVQIPCLVDELTEKHFEKAMKAGVEQWLRDHPEVIRDAVSNAIDEGAFAAVRRVLDNRMETVFELAMGQMTAQGLLPPGGG